MNIEKAKEIMKEIGKETDYKCFPLFNVNDQIICLVDYIFINKKNEDIKYSDEVEKLLEEYVDNIINDKKGFYNEVVEFGYKVYDELKKRNKMYKIYTTTFKIPKKQIGDEIVEEINQNVYDYSVLKFQDDNGLYPDPNYFKTPPDYIKDLDRFNKLMVPIDFSTIYLLNEQEKAILDLRKLEVFLLPITQEEKVESS